MKKITIILLTLMLMYSCNSDNTNEINNTNNFYALTVGNSWEYKYYLKDIATNNFIATSITEMVNITHTIETEDLVWFNFRHIVEGNQGNSLFPDNGEKNFILRDSSGYLIDQSGGIKYASNSYEEYFIDGSTNFTYHLKLSEQEDTITTNAGSFNCLDNHYFLRDINGDVLNSLDHIYREDGKGEILSTISYASQSEHFAEKRLESYTIQ